MPEEGDLILEPLLLNEEHLNTTHERWIKLLNRPLPPVGEEWPDWTNDQCGACRFYVPLQGVFASDWGVCTNASSKLDGHAMFEHDGCESYSGASDWVSSYIANHKTLPVDN